MYSSVNADINLEDVFLTTEECILLKEVDDIIRKKRFSELKSLDEV